MKEKADIGKLARLFAVMFKIGAFTFGGGYAMIPQMTRDFVDKRHWVENEELVDMFALAQSMPGVMAVNAAYLVGHRVAGAAGAVIAALGAVLPSFIVLAAVAVAYRQVIDNPWIQGAMRGVRAAVAALLLSAVVKLRPTSLKGIISWVLFAAALGLALFTAVNVIFILLGGALAGLAYMKLDRARGGKPL